jgi:hypothetical protein
MSACVCTRVAQHLANPWFRAFTEEKTVEVLVSDMEEPDAIIRLQPRLNVHEGTVHGSLTEEEKKTRKRAYYRQWLKDRKERLTRINTGQNGDDT